MTIDLEELKQRATKLAVLAGGNATIQVAVRKFSDMDICVEFMAVNGQRCETAETLDEAVSNFERFFIDDPHSIQERIRQARDYIATEEKKLAAIAGDAKAVAS